MRKGIDFDYIHPTCTSALPTPTPANCVPPPVDGDLLQVMPGPVFRSMTDHQIEVRADGAAYRPAPCSPTLSTVLPFPRSPWGSLFFCRSTLLLGRKFGTSIPAHCSLIPHKDRRRGRNTRFRRREFTIFLNTHRLHSTSMAGGMGSGVQPTSLVTRCESNTKLYHGQRHESACEL